MALPPISPNDSETRKAATVNALVKEHNRPDRMAPIYGGPETGTGAAYVINPVPGIDQYRIGQEFRFQAVHANTTTTPTANMNGLGAGTITYPKGTALGLGDIAANNWIALLVTSLTPTFALIWR